ncbi:hypothetical protein [Nocardiopsis tropica]|uniref:DNA-3-methyladenine glycosylase II n=1 Tax=Nocardiopsis tropica TaxID=109330 RepID=A0ABU7KQG1_9ACTN|nr:hypothetical protein [Nocardiopsis umidischolae]MEE2051337.1 hypothetical protein [Nocardiopsis umidischolae]
MSANQSITATRLGEGTDPAPHVDVYDPKILGENTPTVLRAPLLGQGSVRRLRNPDLWDALATGIIRQVIRADQARLMYHRFCDAHGTATPSDLRAFPRAEAVLALNQEDFATLGMAFKRRPLIAAAEAFLALGSKWAELPPEDLVAEVQTVPRIGPWTAGAAVADVTGDFSLYPHGDMAVRKYAAQAAPVLDQPNDEATFARWWRSFATTPAELSTLTVLTLALGGPRGQDRPPS